METENEALNKALEMSPTAGGSSMMEQLRDKRKQISEHQELDLPVQGYNGLLVARYRLMDIKEFNIIGQRVNRQVKDKEDRLILASIDTIIEANMGLYYRSEEGDLKPLGPNGTEHAMTFTDPNLATELGFEATSARDIVRGVFADNDVAMVQHNVQLNRWMADTGKEVDQSFLGE